MLLRMRPFRLRREKGGRPDGLDEAWAPLQAVAAELEKQRSASEREFLAVGESLAELRGSARCIAQDLAVLPGLISGESGRRTGEALDDVLKQSRSLRGYLEETESALQELSGNAAALRLAFAGLPGTVATLRSLCTLTRIETSRLGSTGAGFADLAEEVGPLSEAVQRVGETVTGAATSLQEGVQAALHSVGRIRAGQLHELPGLVDAVSAGLADFAGQQQLAAEASTRQSAAHQELCGAIDEMVRRIQFHDITRQQIEHVTEALRQAPEGGLPAKSLVLLQASQLRAAARTFSAAVEGISGDLANIASQLGSMAEAGASLAGGDASGEDFFQRMEGCFGAILRVLAESTGAHRKIQAQAGSVEPLLEKMRDSTAEISGIELLVQRIALNASIRADHIGARGNPLSVIADRMQSVVAALAERTGTAAGRLEASAAPARRLAGAEDVFACAAEACRELQGCNLDMVAARERAGNQAREISRAVERLARQIAEVSRRFSPARQIAGVLEKASGALEAIAEELAAEGEEAREVETLAGRYTMQTERQVHAEFLEGEAASVAGEASLGDNVELF